MARSREGGMRKGRWRMARRISSPGAAHPQPDLLRAAEHRRGGNEPVDRAGVATGSGTTKRARVAEALDVAPGLRACRICGRATRGFYYTHLMRPDRYPTFAFCSRTCQLAGAAIAKRTNGMIDK